VNSLLNPQKPADMAKGLFIIGELGLKSKKKVCLKYLKSKNLNLRMYSAISLAKFGNRSSIPVLVDLLFSKNKKIAGEVKKLMDNVDVRISKNIDKIVEHIVKERVDEMVEQNQGITLQQIDFKNLLILRQLYALVEEYDEVEIINNIIKP